MSFRMASLTRSKSGSWTARKGIPKDVQDEYERLYGQRWEAKLTLSSRLTPHQAKAETAEWVADIERRIDAVRASHRGERQSLSQKQVRALAGEWYTAFTAEHEENPGAAERWAEAFWVLVDRLEEHHPGGLGEARLANLDDWIREPAVRAGIRPIVAKEAQTDQFLANRGLSLTPDAYNLFVDYVLEELVKALLLLERRADGDYSTDTHVEELPVFKSKPKTQKHVGLTPWDLFEAWVAMRKPARATITRWRRVFLDLDQHFVDRDAASITEDEAKAWADGLVTAKRAASTVNSIWCNAARTVFAWARQERKLKLNPFAETSVTQPRKARSRGKHFFDDEIKLILRCASAIHNNPKRPFDAARRWVPWLCAYTGARPGEITQLRGVDVIEEDGVSAIKITPDAGSVKTLEARTVPLHEHLIEQGFIEFVSKKGRGPLFYSTDTPLKATSDDPTNPVRPRAVKTRERLAGWVRSIGVTDQAIRPNHAWRHTFVLRADRADIPEKMSAAITGHAQASVGRSYGAPTVGDMAKALKKFRRYEIE